MGGIGELFFVLKIFVCASGLICCHLQLNNLAIQLFNFYSVGSQNFLYCRSSVTNNYIPTQYTLTVHTDSTVHIDSTRWAQGLQGYGRSVHQAVGQLAAAAPEPAYSRFTQSQTIWWNWLSPLRACIRILYHTATPSRFLPISPLPPLMTNS